MPVERRQVTLSKSQRETTAGRELIDLLVAISADGTLSREELERLRKWLEVDHAVDFPALAFLYETIDQISSDGEITEDELDRLAFAIEREGHSCRRRSKADRGAECSSNRSARESASGDD